MGTPDPDPDPDPDPVSDPDPDTATPTSTHRHTDTSTHRHIDASTHRHAQQAMLCSSGPGWRWRACRTCPSSRQASPTAPHPDTLPFGFSVGTLPFGFSVGTLPFGFSVGMGLSSSVLRAPCSSSLPAPPSVLPPPLLLLPLPISPFPASLPQTLSGARKSRPAAEGGGGGSRGAAAQHTDVTSEQQHTTPTSQGRSSTANEGHTAMTNTLSEANARKSLCRMHSACTTMSASLQCQRSFRCADCKKLAQPAS
eukprot:1555973-Rhodomonas_salina.1